MARQRVRGLPTIPSRRPKRPRPGSASAAVREWVLGLEPRTVFWISDLPTGLRPYASRVLHDMVHEYRAIDRIANGFYRRGHDTAPGMAGEGLFELAQRAIAYAGAGCGFGGTSALNKVGWSTQVPVVDTLCVPGRVPECAIHATRFVTARNDRRRELTWPEVTIIEATLLSEWAEVTVDDYLSPDLPVGTDYRALAWRRALEALASGRTMRRLGRGTVLRGEALASVAAAEPEQSPWFASRLADVVSIIGHLQTHPDPAPQLRYFRPPLAGDPFNPM